MSYTHLQRLRKTPLNMQRRARTVLKELDRVRGGHLEQSAKRAYLDQLAKSAIDDLQDMAATFDGGWQDMMTSALGTPTAEGRKRALEMFDRGADIRSIAEYACTYHQAGMLAALAELIPELSYSHQLPPADHPDQAVASAYKELYAAARRGMPELDNALQEHEIMVPYIHKTVDELSSWLSMGPLLDGYQAKLPSQITNWLGRPGSTAPAFLPLSRDISDEEAEVYQLAYEAVPARAASRPKDLQDTGSQWQGNSIVRTGT